MILLRSAAAFLALLLLAGAVFCYLELRSAGYPDGHLTAYEQAVALPYRIFCAEAVLLAAGFAWAASADSARVARRFLLVSLAGLGLLVVPCAGVRYYLRDYLRLEQGTGG